MSQALATSDLVLAALRDRLITALPPLFDVRVGWIEDGPIPADKRVLTLEVGTSDLELANPHVARHTHPAEDAPPVTTMTLDGGRAVLPITATVWVKDRARGRGMRMAAAADVLRVFGPTEPGRPSELVLTLGDDAGTSVRIAPEAVEMVQNPEGAQRDEWRAIIRLEARHALLVNVEGRYLRTIQIGETAEELKPINEVLAED